MTAFLPPLASYLTWATIGPSGHDTAEGIPAEFLATHECTLVQQRDNLAAWVAANRKQKAA